MHEISRRVFLELLAAAGAGSAMVSGALSNAADAVVRLTRPLPWYSRSGATQTYTYRDMCL